MPLLIAMSGAALGLNMVFRKLVIAAAILFACVSCLYVLLGGPARGTYFPHKPHLKGEAASCASCHPTVATSTDTKAPPKTNWGGCKECHKPEQLARVKRFQGPPIMHFSHERHVGKESMECMACHDGINTDTFMAPRAAFPKMEACGACHGDWVADPATPSAAHRDRCGACHLSKDSMKPRDHYENWMEQHKASAGHWESSCRSCHEDKRGCVNCHAGGRFRPKSHGLTFVRTHKFDVRNTVQNCSSCHSNNDCKTCHQSYGVEAGTGGRSRAFSPHPPGFTTDVPNTGRHHGTTARMHLDTCRSCHVKNDCASCHVQRFRFGR